MEKIYDLIYSTAFKYAYGNVNCIAHDLYVSVGIEAMAKAFDTYTADGGASLFTYAYQCVHNAMINEKARQERHFIDTKEEDENFDLEQVGGSCSTADEDMKRFVIQAVYKACKRGNSGKRALPENIVRRNTKIVCMNIGVFGGEEVELKTLAKKFNLSHELVRVLCLSTKQAIAADKATSALLWEFVG